VTPGVVEDIFFTNLLGTTQIDSVIPYILKMDPDYASLGERMILNIVTYTI